MQHQSIADRVLRPRGETERRVRAAPVKPTRRNMENTMSRAIGSTGISGESSPAAMPSSKYRTRLSVSSSRCMRRSALGTFKSTARRCQSFERFRLSPSTHRKSRPYTEDPAWSRKKMPFWTARKRRISPKNRSHARGRRGRSHQLPASRIQKRWPKRRAAGFSGGFFALISVRPENK